MEEPTNHLVNSFVDLSNEINTIYTDDTKRLTAQIGLFDSIFEMIKDEKNSEKIMNKFCDDNNLTRPNSYDKGKSFFGKIWKKIISPYTKIKETWEKVKDFYKKWYGKVVILGSVAIGIGLLIFLI